MNSNPTLRVVDIVDGTSVDGPGLRTSIYFAGCDHHCPGCHNPSTWSHDAGHDMTVEQLLAHIESNGFNVTFSGGDPLYQATNAAILAAAIKQKLGKTIWCYTGFRYEELISTAARQLLDNIDILVDGPFIESLRDTSLHFRGSSNQRLIDIKATAESGRIIEWSRD